jgi:hypothetical protein
MDRRLSILLTWLLSNIICLFLLYNCLFNARIRMPAVGIWHNKLAIFLLTGKLLN